MSEKKTVSALLDVEVFVTCPNDECANYIDLLKERDTDGTMHDDDSFILRQIFSASGNYVYFECDEVTCSKCKTTFDVKELEW